MVTTIILLLELIALLYLSKKRTTFQALFLNIIKKFHSPRSFLTQVLPELPCKCRQLNHPGNWKRRPESQGAKNRRIAARLSAGLSLAFIYRLALKDGIRKFYFHYEYNTKPRAMLLLNQHFCSFITIYFSISDPASLFPPG